ncbi:hypothetical protein L228DRAFT_267745 [Xylona heveae TC161]|uniref:Nitrogen regulatory protein areA GATA-like domain-containing protein n=1 Tax=Xylona heveae (strain CBS 132557 / TC161) TaxID=1328760 RepID=A0A165HNL9_XYLHT|nr:hypothetical protein L228DRAFT_267745 [Xylona heveae TC161]KZF23778.1 hypothetical protein L228DRAFT_267745 [Xylona heveae TC161]
MTEVLSVPAGRDGDYFSTSHLRRSAPSQSSFFDNPQSSYSKSKSSYGRHDRDHNFSVSTTSSAPSSPPHFSHTNFSNPSSLDSTSVSSLSSESKFSLEDDPVVFPSYDDVGYYEQIEDLDTSSSLEPQNDESEPANTEQNPKDDSSVRSNSPRRSSPEPPALAAEDDTAIRSEPSRHVDYLSHDWKEEDIWSSWKHIVSKRKLYGQSSRLENASWRTWAKSKYHLRTVSPETLNWLKDCDVTWLYGPLQPGSNKSFSPSVSEPQSRLSKSNSFLNKKPILKKRSMSEVMLQRSISAASLLKQAAAAVQAQQSARNGDGNRPPVGRAASDYITSCVMSPPMSRGNSSALESVSSSGIPSPSSGERRHIRFAEKVEQCIAVDSAEDTEEEDDYSAMDEDDDDDSSDDGLVMMKKTPRRPKPPRRNSSRNSTNGENKTIAKLPSTTLKYKDTPEDETPKQQVGGFWGTKLSPSPSQETLRPSRPSSNFLLDEEDEDVDLDWEPSRVSHRENSSYDASSHIHFSSTESEGTSTPSGLRRTPSGMFMPYEEDEDDVVAAGLFGRVVDTVNTAKDIAHVIWNVGWRR